MDKRIISSLSLLLLLLSSCTNEYFSYHQDKLVYENSLKQQLENNVTFKANDIVEKNLGLMTLPDKKVLDEIIKDLTNAKRRIYLEVYILTEKRIIKALSDAKSRGLDVEVILEKNVFGAGSINFKAFNALQKAGIKVIYADDSSYRFTHAKYFIIDNSYLISTGNMSSSTFAYNKEFILKGSEERDLKILDEVFKHDMEYEKLIKCDNSLVISPICPRNQFKAALASAKKSIHIYVESFDDIQLMQLLGEKKKKGIDVRVFLGDIKKVASNKKAYDIFVKAGIPVIAPKKPYIHAKAFIVDSEIIYIGSINLTTNSIMNNREVGMVFRNSVIASSLENEFLTNFAKLQ